MAMARKRQHLCQVLLVYRSRLFFGASALVTIMKITYEVYYDAPELATYKSDMRSVNEVNIQFGDV